jgi:hypothetical protein
MFVNGNLNGHENELNDFYTKFFGRLREEVRLGIDAASHFGGLSGEDNSGG